MVEHLFRYLVHQRLNAFEDVKPRQLIDLEYKRNVGYKCDNESIVEAITFNIEIKDYKVGYENELYKIINVFEFNAKTYCNCWDKKSNKMFLIVGE